MSNEADFYEGGDEDPPGPSPNDPYGRNTIPYRGNDRSLFGTLGLINSIMGYLGMKPIFQAGVTWGKNPSLPTRPAGDVNICFLIAQNMLANSAVTEDEYEPDAEFPVGASISIGGGAVAAGELGASAGVQTAVEQAMAEAGVQNSVATATPWIAAVVMAGTALYTMYAGRNEGNKPFSLRRLNNLKDRNDDAGKTARKFLEAGFNGNDTIQQIFGDVVRTPQDYYAFRENYFVGNFETDTFRKDFGLSTNNFYPVEEPEYELIGDNKIYLSGDKDIDSELKKATTAINELKGEGYSELRILEDIGSELDPQSMDYFKESDLRKLEEARKSGDLKEYISILGGMSTEVGQEADIAAYQETVGILSDAEVQQLSNQQNKYSRPFTEEEWQAAKYRNYNPDADPDGRKSFIYDDLRSLKDDMADVFENGNFTDEQIVENNKWINDLLTAGIQAGGTMAEMVAGAGRYAKWANNAFKKALEAGDIDSELVDKVFKAAPGIMGIAELIPDELLNKADEYSKTLNAIGNAKSSDELKSALERFDGILEAAEKRALDKGADVSDTAVIIGEAWTEAIAQEPYAFFMNKILVESFEEFAPFIAGAASKIAQTGAKNLFEEFGSKQIQEWAKNLDPKDAGLFEAKAADLIEVIGLEANGAYEESKALATNKEAAHIQKLEKARGNEITLEEAIELIDTDTLAKIEEEAQMDGFSTGTVAAFSNIILNKELGGNALIDSIFKDAAKGIDGGMKSVRQYFTEKVAMLAKEGFTESLEEAIPAWFKNERWSTRGLKEEGQALVDTVSSFFGGFFTGIGTSGTVSTVNDIANIPKNSTEYLSNIVKTTNAEVKSIIDRAYSGEIDLAEATEAMDMFGITADEYGALQTQLLNDPFDADFTTVGEVTQSFEDANPNYKASSETIDSYVGQNLQAELDAKINEFVDQNYVDAEEVRAIAEAEGLTLTDEEIAKYVQQVDDNGAEAKLADMTSVFDRLYTTEAEVRELLAEAGYDPDSPWASGESIDDIVADLVGKPEDSNLTDKVNETSLLELQLQFNSALDAGADAATLDLILDRIEALDTDSTIRTDSNLDDSGSAVDPDSDNDGIPDSTDEFPDDPWNGNPPPGSDSFPTEPGTDTTDTSNQITWLDELPPVGQQIVRAMVDMGVDPSTIKKEDILARYFYDGRPNQRLISQFFSNYSKYKSDPSDADDTDTDTGTDTGTEVTNQELLDLINKYEQEGMTRDEALQAAIDELASSTSTDIDAIANLVGKPVSEVTQADIDFISNVIAEQEILADPSSYEFTEDQLLYDVTGDGVVNQEDQVLLESLMAGDTSTLAALESKFAPTGLYEMLQQQAQQAQQDAQAQAEAQAQTQTQIQENQRRSNISDMLQLLGGADDIAGQQVSVKAADPANIDYLYDFSSIFATPRQEQLFADPFGTNMMQPRNPAQPPQPVQRAPLAPFGRNTGGLIDEDEFLRMVGGS